MTFPNSDIQKLIATESSAFDFVNSICSESFWIWILDQPETLFEIENLWKQLGFETSQTLASNLINSQDLKQFFIEAENYNDNPNGKFDQIVRITDKDGLEIQVLFRGKKIKERQFLMNYSIISFHSETVKNLQEDNHRMISLLRASGDFSFVYDTDYRITHFNHIEPDDGLFPPSASLLGKKIDEINLPPEIVETIIKTFDKALETGKKSRTEYSLKTKNEDIWFSLVAASVSYDDGKPQEIICSIHNITERKNVEIELENKKLFKQTLLDNIPGYVVCKDMNGKYLYVNKEFADFFGKTVEEVRGKYDSDFEHNPKAVQRYRNADKQVLKTKLPIYGVEETFVREDGFTRIFKTDRIFVDIIDQKNGAILVVVKDVTKDRIFEAELLRTKTILENCNVVGKVGTWELDLIKKKLFWSQITRKIHEVSEDYKPILETAINFYPEGENRETITRLINECIADGISFDVELKFLTAKDNEIWVKAVGSPEFENGKCVAVFGAFQNIDVAKKEEERLKLLESVITNTKDSVLILETGTLPLDSKLGPKIVFVNESFQTNSGYSFDEVIGKTPRILYGPNTDAEQLIKMRSAMNNWESGDFDLIYYKKNGEQSWTNFTVVPVANKTGGYSHWVVIARDIHERKLNEQIIYESELRFRTLAETASDAIITIDEKSEIVFVNNAVEKIFGYTAEEAVGEKITLLMPHGLRSSHNNGLSKYVETGEKKIAWTGLELNARHKSGREIPIEVSLGEFLVNGKRFFTGVARDITERKIAVAELLKIQNHLANKTEVLAAIAKTTEKLLSNIDISETLNETFELIGKATKSDRVYYFENNTLTNILTQKIEWVVDDVCYTNESTMFDNLSFFALGDTFLPLLLNQPIQAFTSEIDDLNLREILVSHNVMSFLVLPIFIKNTFYGFIGFDDCRYERRWTVEDIVTYQSLVNNIANAIERMNSDSAIKESENNFRQINETLEAVFWLFDVNEERYVYMSPNCKKVLGVNPEYFYLGNSFVKDNVLDGIDLKSYSEFRRFLETNAYDIDFRIKSEDGEPRWINEKAFAIRNDNGKLFRISGLCTDITEIIQKREQLQHLLNITSDLNKRLLNFAHIVSHNIRSHSSNLSMLVDFIKKSNNQNEKLEYTEMLGQSTEKLAETIQNLNEIITIQTNFQQKKSSLNLRQEFEKTTKVLSSAIKETKTQIINEISEDLFVSVIPSYLESIFLNLLTNSIKYRSIEKDTIIKVSAQSYQNFIIVSFTDNGIGIDLSMHRHKIFGMYKTFHGNSDARGIGLFMTKNQIEAMNGSIEVDSKIGIGTTFKISFKINE